MQGIVATVHPGPRALAGRRDVSARERRAPHTAACIAVAVAIHLALFFGVQVAAPLAPAPSAVVPVVLATLPAVDAPEAAPEQTPTQTPPADASQAETRKAGERSVAGSRTVEPRAEAPRPSASSPSSPVAAPRRSPFAGASLNDLALATAANAAPSATRRAGLRVRRLGNVAPPSPDFAYYLNSWRRKVERIGQLNYPQQARAEGIVGNLRLLVAIAPDGALDEVRVLETSGHKLLDDAALRIVRLAAPYAPFPPAMKATTDILEIERTWRFLDSRLSS